MTNTEPKTPTPREVADALRDLPARVVITPIFVEVIFPAEVLPYRVVPILAEVDGKTVRAAKISSMPSPRLARLQAQRVSSIREKLRNAGLRPCPEE